MRAILDGELVALDENGNPDFPQLCACVRIDGVTSCLYAFPEEPRASLKASAHQRTLQM